MKDNNIKSIHKSQIRKNIAAIASFAVFITGVSGIIVEESTDHTEQICPLCTILGIKHQANSINRNSEKYDGASAEYLEDYDDTVYIKRSLAYPSGSTVIDGKAYINGKQVDAVAPMVPGYTLILTDSNYATYKKTTHYDECVKITNSDDTTKILSRNGK